MKLKYYETLFIINPTISNKKINNKINKNKNFLKNQKSKIINDKKIGIRKLAYPIQKKKTGIYQFFEFQSTPNIIKILEKEYKKDEKIIRFLTILLNKHGIKYNEKEKNKTFLK
jgi:small subunit ribosomal protein S6